MDYELVLNEAFCVSSIKKSLKSVLRSLCVNGHHVVPRVFDVDHFRQLADSEVLADLELVLNLAIDLSLDCVVSLDPQKLFPRLSAKVTVIHRQENGVLFARQHAQKKLLHCTDSSVELRDL
jgi:hypothetical protein